MLKPLVVGNWKMHGSQAMVEALVKKLLSLAGNLDNVDWVVCPPYPYLEKVATYLKESVIELGGQNHAAVLEGAYTGEVSPSMLKDLGASWVILGHSERRYGLGESVSFVAEKTQLALTTGLKPIFCVGETEAQRKSGCTEALLEQQLDPLLHGLAPDVLQNLTLAYEPVWAIGTGMTATPEQAGEVHDFLRKLLVKYDESLAGSVRILYGGSVKPSNAEDLIAVPDIDGFLVGGASLQAQSFFEIGEACIRSY